MTAKRLLTGILAVLVIAAVMAPSLMAQSQVSGDLTGTITDPSGAVVSGATVTLKSDATGATRTATTGANGTYRFSLLQPGSYTVMVTASGFSKTTSTANVNVGQASIADVKMAVGSSSTTVEVTSSAPLVQADSADLSTNFSQSLIANQPNGGNDMTYIAQTTPGAVMNAAGGYGNFSVYGLPATSNVFTVNGENDMDPYLNVNNSGATNLTLGRNDLQEATVISNAYSGQYGQQAGAQVNYVTKSGTNNWHGNLIWYWNGSTLNANGWFNDAFGTPKPFANNNQWAASIGGPIKKDKWFFFLNSEGLRFILPTSGQVFAWAGSPTTPGSFIAQSLAQVAAQNPIELPLYQKYYSLFGTAPGRPGSCNSQVVQPDGTGYQCSYVANAGQNGREFIASSRVDYNMSDKDHLFWRVRVDQGTQPTASDFINPAFSANSYQPAYDGQGQWSHVFSPNLTNQFVYAGSYYRAIFIQGGCCDGFPFTVIGSGITDGSGTPLNLTRVGGLAYDFPQGRNVTQYQFVDDLSWTKGAHALKFGANFRRYDISDYTFSVLNNPEVIITDVNLDPTDSGSFANGFATQTRKRYPSQLSEPTAIWGLGLYAQDEWRVNKSLKLTFALRAEHNSNPHCQTACGSLLDGSFQGLVGSGAINPAAPYNSFINANRTNLYRGVDSINWGPRFGFAWSPGGSDKTVVRGGFGIFYDALAAGVVDNFMLNIPNVVTVYNTGAIPWADTTTPNSPYVQGAASAAAIKTGFANGASFDSLQAQLGAAFKTPTYNNQSGTFHTPYYEQWSLGIQQAVGDKASLSLTYVGNHGVRIPINNPWGNAYCNPAAGCNYAPGVLPGAPATPVFTTVQQWQSGAVSNYSGITAAYNQRLTYGFSVQASYTWSHAMDEVSNGGFQPFSDNTDVSLLYQVNPTCLRCNNYGNADYDIRSYFSGSYVWQTPWKFGNKYVNGAIGGWTISQNFFARTGLPFTVLDFNNPLSNFTPNTGFNVGSVITPGQTSCNGSTTNAGTNTCLNAANFYQPVFDVNGNLLNPQTAFSNQRRNMYHGPGFFDSDFSVSKGFKLTERMAFSIGANFYNIFNHPNFDLPDNGLGDATFGQSITSALPPTGPYGSFFANLPSARVIQFQGKLVF